MRRTAHAIAFDRTCEIHVKKEQQFQIDIIMWDCRVAVTLSVTVVWSLFAWEGHAASLSADNRQGVSFTQQLT